ncbi:hypothetical protein DFP72DRAFT_1092464, partial [Ephemerocybe angulata]
PPSQAQSQKQPSGGIPARVLQSPATPSRPAKTKVEAEESEEKRLQKYQLRSNDLPQPDGEKVKVAFLTHIRLIGGLPEATSVLKVPDAKILKNFRENFANEDSLTSQQNGGELLIPDSSVKVYSYGPATQDDRRRTRTQIGQVEEHAVEYIRIELARFGLPIWGPNFLESPYSLYNSACRIVALDTFKQALKTGAYDFLDLKRKINLRKYATRLDLLIKIYDHIIH